MTFIFVKIFFDPNFSLANRDIFNSIISQRIFQSDDSKNYGGELNPSNGLIISPKKRIEEAESCKLALDKVRINFEYLLNLDFFC